MAPVVYWDFIILLSLNTSWTCKRTQKKINYVLLKFLPWNTHLPKSGDKQYCRGGAFWGAFWGVRKLTLPRSRGNIMIWVTEIKAWRTWTDRTGKKFLGTWDFKTYNDISIKQDFQVLRALHTTGENDKNLAKSGSYNWGCQFNMQSLGKSLEMLSPSWEYKTETRSIAWK